jgi:predicted NBD/HSP70 family sugar kinase
LSGKFPYSGEGVPGFAAGTPSLLRAINERSLLELIRRDGAMSRAEAARRSGLSKPTVSQALLGLEDAGLVHQAGRSQGPKGPGAVVYSLNPESGWVVGLDVGSHWVRAALADITGTVRARRDERTHRSSAATVAQISALAHSLAAERGIDWSHVTHATVGLPGVLDPSRTHLALSPNLPGGKQGLVEAIRAELGTKVSFDNDVNLAALGERARGVGRGIESFVFLWVGTGIGLGIVVDGQLYRGAAGAAGEIAYLPVGPGDPHDPAYRRRGQLEESASAAAAQRLARERGLRPASPKSVFAAARRGDPAAAEVVELIAGRIALAIAAVVPVLDPALVILGGGIAGNGGDLLLEPIERELHRISPFRPRLAVSALGDEVVLHGAVATALAAAQETLFDRVREAQPRESVG